MNEFYYYYSKFDLLLKIISITIILTKFIMQTKYIIPTLF